jgi:hypothetical protein
MAVARKVRLTWQTSAAEPVQTRVFASEARARRFTIWHVPSNALVTLEPIGATSAKQQTTDRRAEGGRRPPPRAKAGACAICGRWRQANGQEGEPSPAWENAVRALEGDD